MFTIGALNPKTVGIIILRNNKEKYYMLRLSTTMSARQIYSPTRDHVASRGITEVVSSRRAVRGVTKVILSEASFDIEVRGDSRHHAT